MHPLAAYLANARIASASNSPFAGEDVSILIPTYRRGSRIRRTVEAALRTGAGEIIVSDNASDDETPRELAAIADPRLKVVRQSINCGIWRNHLAALKLATRPWVKFLQDDDSLAPDALARMLKFTGSKVSVIAALAMVEDSTTGKVTTPFALERPIKWHSDEYLRRIPFVGNTELGNPSNTLFLKRALDTSDEAWANDQSSDFIANVIAASRGEVVLIPPGPIVIRRHPGQDTFNQSAELLRTRLFNTISFLKRSPDSRVRVCARRYAATEGLVRVALCLRRECVHAEFRLGLELIAQNRGPAGFGETWLLARRLLWGHLHSRPAGIAYHISEL